MLLSEMLHRHGIGSVVLEKHSRAAAADRRNANVLTEVEYVQPTDVTSEHPRVTYRQGGEALQLSCNFLVGCVGNPVADCALAGHHLRESSAGIRTSIGTQSDSQPQSRSRLHRYAAMWPSPCAAADYSLPAMPPTLYRLPVPKA